MAENEFQDVKQIVNKALDYKNNGDYNQAEELLKKGLDKYPENNYLIVSFADLFYEQKNLDKAMELIDEILDKNPDYLRALSLKGKIYFTKREYKKAKKFYEKAYQNKENEYTAFQLIRVLNKLEEYKRALKISSKWLDKADDKSYFKKIAASIYENLSKNKKALSLYKDYLAENPEDNFAYKEMIKLKLRDKETKKVVEKLKEILKDEGNNKNPHLHILLAEKLEDLKKDKEAVREYKKALELDPHNKLALKELGFSLYKAGDYKKALPYLKEEFRSDPGDYYTRSVLMNIFKELNKEEEGINFFKDIINNNPGFENLWGMIKKLSKSLKNNN